MLSFQPGLFDHSTANAYPRLRLAPVKARAYLSHLRRLNRCFVVSLPADGLVDTHLDEAVTNQLLRYGFSWRLVDPGEIAHLEGRTTGFDARPWTVLAPKQSRDERVTFGPQVKLLPNDFTAASLAKEGKRFGNPSEDADEGSGMPLLFLGTLAVRLRRLPKISSHFRTSQRLHYSQANHTRWRRR